MLSCVWLFIIILSLGYGLITNVIDINNVILNVSYDSLETFFQIASGLILWSGILEVAKTTGFLNFCTKGVNQITKLLFKTKDDYILSLISANFICNFLGLTTMATPFSLEAISELKKEKGKYDIDYVLILNYVAASFLPISMITLRNSYSSYNTMYVVPFIVVLGLFNTILGFILVRLYRWRF